MADEDELLQALGAEVLRMTARRLRTYQGAVLDHSAFRILWSLVRGGPRPLATLGEELDVDRSTISRQVSAAVERGLVERAIGEDPRTRVVRATDAGIEAYEADLAIRAGIWSAAVAEVGELRAARLVGDLNAFNDALDRAHERARSGRGS